MTKADDIEAIEKRLRKKHLLAPTGPNVDADVQDILYFVRSRWPEGRPTASFTGEPLKLGEVAREYIRFEYLEPGSVFAGVAFKEGIQYRVLEKQRPEKARGRPSQGSTIYVLYAASSSEDRAAEARQDEED